MPQPDPLITRLQHHYHNLAPHVQERQTAQLLLEALHRIIDLTVALNRLPACNASCNGVLRVDADRYNQAIELAKS